MKHNKKILNIIKECDHLTEDASKCKREWDDIDRWASNSDIDDKIDDLDAFYKDRWQPYDSCAEPFLRSKYLKHGK